MKMKLTPMYYLKQMTACRSMSEYLTVMRRFQLYVIHLLTWRLKA